MLVRLAPFWFVLAGLSQLVYLTGWPMALFGVPASAPWSIAIALIRMGVYLGIGCGLWAREPTAWAAAVMESARTGIAFLVAIWVRDWLTGSPVYPAWWLQGLLTALLPALVIVNACLAGGWRPGAVMELVVRTLASLVAATHVVGANTLAGRASDYDLSPEERRTAVLRAIPLVLVVWSVEWLAVADALRRH
jgi:hypothetical protein